MSNTEIETMNTETENITSIITAETGMTIEPPVRKRKIIKKKVAEPSMKEATELAEGKTLVIKEEAAAEEKPNCGAGKPEIQLSGDGLKLYTELRVSHDKWMKLYLELKEKTDPLLAKLEEQRLKHNEASKKSKKAQRDKAKAVKTDLEERVKKLEEKVAEKEFKEVLGGTCDNCGDEYAEHGCDADHCWLTHKCADCDNHADDIGDGKDEDGNELNPLCADCRAMKEEQSDEE